MKMKRKNIIKMISLPKSYRMKMFEGKAENVKWEMNENFYNVEFKYTRTRTVANTNIIIINLKWLQLWLLIFEIQSRNRGRGEERFKIDLLNAICLSYSALPFRDASQHSPFITESSFLLVNLQLQPNDPKLKSLDSKHEAFRLL